MYHPTRSEINNTQWDGNLIPIYREIVADMETPVSAFLKINHGGTLSYWKVSRAGKDWRATVLSALSHTVS